MPRFPWKRDIKAGILARVSKDGNGCWNWMLSISPDGYPRGGTPTVSIHRLSYEKFVGEIPDGLSIDHLCSNRRCVNPEHLEPVTMDENRRRASAKRTHCVHGHEFTPENTYNWQNKMRVCRTCGRRRTSEYLKRKGIRK